MTSIKIGQPPTATTNPRSQYRLADPFPFYCSAPELTWYGAKALQLSSIFILYPRPPSKVTYCGSHKARGTVCPTPVRRCHSLILSLVFWTLHPPLPQLTYRPAPGQSTPPIMDINQLIEPRSSRPLKSKKNSASVASLSTGATGTYTTPSAHRPTSITSMHGGPVLPAITKPHQQGLSSSNESPPSQKRERDVSETLLAEESPAKKQSKWTSEEDNLTIELRGQGMKWDDIAKRLPGRSYISCRLRYQNYLEKRAVWDEEKKNKLATLYARCVKRQIFRIPSMLGSTARVAWNALYATAFLLTSLTSFKDQMWQKVANEMGVPWRSAESMHWQLGEQEISARANVPIFQLHPSGTSGSMDTESTIEPGDMSSPSNTAPDSSQD